MLENVSSLLSHLLPTTITQPPTIQEFIILIVMFKTSPVLSMTLERSFLVTLLLLGEKQRLHISGKSFTFFVVEKMALRGTLPGVWLAVPLLCSGSPTSFPLYSGKSAEKSAMTLLLCWHCTRHCHFSNGKLSEHSKVDRDSNNDLQTSMSGVSISIIIISITREF